MSICFLKKLSSDALPTTRSEMMKTKWVVEDSKVLQISFAFCFPTCICFQLAPEVFGCLCHLKFEVFSCVWMLEDGGLFYMLEAQGCFPHLKIGPLLTFTNPNANVLRRIPTLFLLTLKFFALQSWISCTWVLVCWPLITSPGGLRGEVG